MMGCAEEALPPMTIFRYDAGSATALVSLSASQFGGHGDRVQLTFQAVGTTLRAQVFAHAVA